MSWMKGCIIFLTTGIRLSTCILPKFTGPKDDPKNDTFFVAALPEIQSILFDAST